MAYNPQLNANGELQHLLTIEGLPREIIVGILDTAHSFLSVAERENKKVPLLRGKSVFNLFVECEGDGHERDGLGLGLSLVEQLVVLHGGSVSVFSTGQPGDGAEFVVRLARSTAPHAYHAR